MKKITRYSKESSNFDFLSKQYKNEYLERKIKLRMDDLGLHEKIDYIKILNSNRCEFDELNQLLSTEVTSFFRDLDSFVLLEQIIEKYILTNYERNEKIFIFHSIGCADGSEIYSLAMMIDFIINKNPDKNFIFQLTGFDINKVLISKAKNGIFNSEKIDLLSSKIKETYFTEINKDLFRINKNFNSDISFKVLGVEDYLISEKSPDIIMCRNVLIYFNTEFQKRILDNFYQFLRPDGLLFLGKTESIPLSFKEKFVNLEKGKSIFQRI